MQREWIFGVALVSLIGVLVVCVYVYLVRYLRRQQDTKGRRFAIQKYLANPIRAILITVGLRVSLPFIPYLPQALLELLEPTVECLLVLFAGWLVIGAIYTFEAFVLSRFDTTVADNLRARRAHTQIQFFRRILIAIALLLDAGALLWSLHDPRLWKFGTGLLASAGLVSLVLAAAAKSTASNLIAGMQIALSEPIRMDDVVVVQGEWGRIEEITSTYVIVRIWDERRLVVPLSYFIEQPFENWTRRTSRLLGTAFLYVDYSVPVESLRNELQRIVSASPLWDGKVCALQVTNLTDRAVELRCLVSASDSSRMFDLRCLVREQMLDYLTHHYPQALPTCRLAFREVGNELSNAGLRQSLGRTGAGSREPGPLPGTS